MSDMSDLEDRLRSVLPDAPPKLVIYAFQYGASLSDVLQLTGLSGAALAKAKLYLPQIRRDAVRQAYQPDKDILALALDTLAESRPAAIAQRGRDKFVVLRHQLESTKYTIGDLCSQQKTNAHKLKIINECIVQASRSSALGARSVDALIAEHNKCIAIIHEVFYKMLTLAEGRCRLLAEVTKFLEPVLFIAGCEVPDIHAAGGTTRTARTVYNRTARLGRAQSHQFSDDFVIACTQLLGRIAEYEAATINLRKSVKSDLQILQHPPGATTLSRSMTAEGAWTGNYWTKTNHVNH